MTVLFKGRLWLQLSLKVYKDYRELNNINIGVLLEFAITARSQDTCRSYTYQRRELDLSISKLLSPRNRAAHSDKSISNVFIKNPSTFYQIVDMWCKLSLSLKMWVLLMPGLLSLRHYKKSKH